MRFRSFVFLAAAGSLLATFSVAVAGPEKVSPLLRMYSNPGMGLTFDYPRSLQAPGVLEGAAEGPGISCLVEGTMTREDLEALGVTVGTQAGTVFTAVIPADRIPAVSDLPGVIRIEPARRVKLTLDNATTDTNVRPEVHGTNAPPWTGNTGVGVLIGNVDSGIDYTHEDFKDALGTTRFHRIWDQTVGSSPPAGFSYGTEWTTAQIQAGTSTVTNPDGHGTHVLGILGGDGSSTGPGSAPAFTFVGVAPQATLIHVKTNFTDAGIIDGCNWIFQRGTALGLPTVVNLSLSGQDGPHDGTDPFEVALNALTGSGKIIVASASNDRGAQIHARGTVPVSGSPSSVSFQVTVDPYTRIPQVQNDLVFFTGWYEGTDNYTVTVTSPNSIVSSVIKGVINEFHTNDGAVQIDNGTTAPSNGDTEVFIAFFDFQSTKPPAAGTWTITFNRVTSTNSNIDAWLFYNTMGCRFATGFTDDVTLGNPACAANLVTVAAYTTKTSWPSRDGNNYQWNPLPPLNAIADFSSRGPTRTGGQKPDISGPGFGVVSALSDDVVITPSNAPLILPGDVHWINAGTSMSSPMVAGLAGLIMAKEGALTPTQVKQKLEQFARTDGFTGSVWNADWGWGKMNAEAADVIGPLVNVTAPNGGGSYVAGASVPIHWAAGDNFAVSGVDIYYSTNGGSTYPNLIVAGAVNTGTYNWTAPSINSTTVRVKVVATDTADNTGEDASDANFSISIPDVTPPSVTVLAPNGGESFDLGANTNVTWTSSDTGMKPGLGPLAAATAGVDSVAIWYSLDNGGSWVLVASGEANDGTYSWTLPTTISDSVLVKVTAWDPSLNQGADQSDAVFSVTNQTGVGDLPPPAVLMLAQNRPNPVYGSRSTQIPFGLPKDGRVLIRIYDVRGGLVATVADADYPAGFHQARWDGRGSDGTPAPSGLYFYRLETPSGHLNRKLILVH